MPPDSNIKEGIDHNKYLHPTTGDIQTPNPNHPAVDGRRIVIIPIVKQDQYDQGRNVVRFDRFGFFFLQTKVGGGSGGDLVAEYIDDIVIGQGGFDPNGAPANGLMAVPVLYK
jgi:hypothetical protein